MAAVGAISTPFVLSSSPHKTIVSTSISRFSLPVKSVKKILPVPVALHHSLSSSSTLPPTHARFSPRAASSSSSSKAGTAQYAEEPTTKVKFQTSLTLPGCSSTLSLLGKGYREKVFAIVGVKVYAAGFYVDREIFSKLEAWKGRSAKELKEDSFDTFFHAPSEKSVQIVLVRDVDGKNFWDAFDEAVSPRIKSPSPIDATALSTFRSVFQGRSLKKGTFIFLTWLNPTEMIVSVSSDGIPSAVDATIQSQNVSSALFDVFLGSASVSPSLKASVSDELTAALR